MLRPNGNSTFYGWTRQSLHRDGKRGDGAVPCDFFIVPLSRLHCQTLIVHFMYIARSLHVAQDVVLKLRHWLEGVRHILVLLDVADDLCRFGPFGKVDVVRAFDDRGNAVLDEGQVGKVDAWLRSETYMHTPL